MIKWGLCEHGGEASKDWFLSHISSIYSTPRCRYHAQTYNPENRCPTSKEEAWWSSEVCVNMAAKQAKIDFCRTFRPFIQHHDADIMHWRTIRRTDVQLLNRRLGTSCQALNFRRGPTMYSKCHAHIKIYMPWKTHFKPQPQPCGNPPSSGSAVPHRQERSSIYFNFTKIILVNIWILN